MSKIVQIGSRVEVFGEVLPTETQEVLVDEIPETMAEISRAIFDVLNKWFIGSNAQDAVITEED